MRPRRPGCIGRPGRRGLGEFRWVFEKKKKIVKPNSDDFWETAEARPFTASKSSYVRFACSHYSNHSTVEGAIMHVKTAFVPRCLDIASLVAVSLFRCLVSTTVSTENGNDNPKHNNQCSISHDCGFESQNH